MIDVLWVLAAVAFVILAYALGYYDGYRKAVVTMVRVEMWRLSDRDIRKHPT